MADWAKDGWRVRVGRGGVVLESNVPGLAPGAGASAEYLRRLGLRRAPRLVRVAKGGTRTARR